jgi:hypothetical protein
MANAKIVQRPGKSAVRLYLLPLSLLLGLTGCISSSSSPRRPRQAPQLSYHLDQPRSARTGFRRPVLNALWSATREGTP